MRIVLGKFKSLGFTLIELLIVIVVAGVLATIVLLAVNPGKQLARARDADRKQSLVALSKSLEQYYVFNVAYPNPGADLVSDSTESNWIPNISPDYLKTLPKDPKQAAGVFTNMLAGLLKDSIDGWNIVLSSVFEREPLVKTAQKPQPEVAAASTLKDSSGYYVVWDGADSITGTVLTSSVVSGYILNLDWADLEPTDNGFDWSVIEARKAEIAGKRNWNNIQKKLGIRILAGAGAPMWLTNQKKGSTSFTATTLTDSGANFAPPNCKSSSLAGRNLQVEGQSNAVEVVSNTSTTITVIAWSDGTPAAGKRYAVGGCKSNKSVEVVNYQKAVLQVGDPTLRAIPMVTDTTMLSHWDNFLAALATQYDNDEMISRITVGGPNGTLTEAYITNSIVTENRSPWTTSCPTACPYSKANIVQAWKTAIDYYQNHFSKTPFNYFHSDMPDDDGVGRDNGKVSKDVHAYLKSGGMKQNGFYIPGGNYLSTQHPVCAYPLDGSCAGATDNESELWKMSAEFWIVDSKSKGGWQIAGVKLGNEGGATAPNMQKILDRADAAKICWLEVYAGMINSAVPRDVLVANQAKFADCSVGGVLPTPTPTPIPTPTPTPIPTPIPSLTPTPPPPPSASDFKYLYTVTAALQSYTLWAILENTDDPEIYNKPGAKCSLIPPSSYYNYCVSSN